MNTVITSGRAYLDIDAYASCIAYRELLNAVGQRAFAVTTAPFNNSIPQIVKDIPLGFDNYTPSKTDKFIVLDLSDPSFFDKFVNHQNIIEIVDHHVGHEEYWATHKHIKAQIEKVGSVATIIFERFIQHGKQNLLTPNLCKLLTAAIVDNTLNLKATITTPRDVTAFKSLLKIGGLDNGWSQQYLDACDKAIFENLAESVKNDTKTSVYESLPFRLGQIAVFNHDAVISQIDLIKSIFKDAPDWALNLISLNDGKSYLIAGTQISKDKLSKIFGKQFNGDILILDKFMLRKEINAKAFSK